MPVIVIGADTKAGESAVRALLPRDGEVRAFVSDPQSATRLKALGVKVALGDVSDASHIGGAGLNTFSAVVIEEAADDDRERSFATDRQAVVQSWAEGLKDAGVRRIIWVGSPHVPPELASAAPETAAVATGNAPLADIAAEIARLDDLDRLES